MKNPKKNKNKKQISSIKRVNLKIKKIKQSPKKPKVCRQKKKSTPRNIVSESPPCNLPLHFRPNLLLQLVYFLNDTGTKNVTIGFDPMNDFRLTIILASNYSFVVMTSVDWFTFLLNIPEVHNFFHDISQDNCTTFKTTRNILLSKHKGPNDRRLQIEDFPRLRANNVIFLSDEEFNRCLALDSYFQPLIKQLQMYPQMISEYYSLYIYHCQTSKKETLLESDYFLPRANENSLDSFRLFKEIPIYCRSKLDTDLGTEHLKIDIPDGFLIVN